MAFRNNSYATVWEIKPNANYTDVRLSTSHKNKQTGEYETDFSNYVRFIGDAHKMAAGLKERDRIHLDEVACTNQYNKEKRTTYYNFQVFAFSSADSTRNTQTADVKYDPTIPEDVTEENLPFN